MESAWLKRRRDVQIVQRLTPNDTGPEKLSASRKTKTFLIQITSEIKQTTVFSTLSVRLVVWIKTLQSFFKKLMLLLCV